MGHVVRDTGWCVIDINTTSGRVLMQERWVYTWLTSGSEAAWTHEQKRAFHNRADQEIWRAWSNRATLTVTGTSDVAQRFARSGLQIALDIKWATANPHWNVRVTKIPRGELRISSVEWTARRINLDTNDFATRTFNAGTANETTQTPVAHEFGHAAGNTAVLGRGDEYAESSAENGDNASIMHSGHRLRSRHFQTIIDEMNQMIPNTVFAVGNIR